MRTSQEKGFIALYLAILVLATLSVFAGTLFLISFRQELVSRNLSFSLQAYYATEGGIEDAILRLKQGSAWSNPIPLSLQGAVVQTTVSDMAGGTRTLVAQGTKSSRTKKVQALYSLSGEGTSFVYGAHVGDGGLVMDNNSQVIGNVFSNSTIQGSSGAIITQTARVARASNKIKDVTVQQDAYAAICENTAVSGTLHANSKTNCTHTAYITPLAPPVDPVPLPITQSQIDSWKQEATAGGTLSGGYSLSGTQTASLGPQKIVGDLIVQNFAQLTVTGVLWVTGDIDIKNDSKVILSSSFGSTSGVIIADGNILLENNSTSKGSGSENSYLMYLSASLSGSAIDIKNNAQADILYTSAGTTVIENNAPIKEVTAYKLHLKNNAVVTYNSGLQSTFFTSGPSGGFQITGWKEIE